MTTGPPSEGEGAAAQAESSAMRQLLFYAQAPAVDASI